MLGFLALAAGGVVAAGGWIAARFRPSARARRRARGSLRRVQKERRRLERLSQEAADGLAASAASYAEHAAEERLGSLPIEELKSFGAEKVRWGVLHDAGLHTAADVKGMSRAQLERLDGVGPVSAKRIKTARGRLLEANREEPVSPPALASRAGEAREAVRRARDVLLVRDSLAGLPARVDAHYEELSERYAGVRRGTRLWRELLGGEAGRAERDAAVEEAARIQQDVAELSAEGGLLERSRRARERARKELTRKISDEELRAEHEERFAEYCALIERALPGRRISLAGGVLGGLTDEIVERVEAFPLRTSGLRLTLRGYQEFGAKYLLAQERTLLGDEMGLGKTIQALAVFTHLAEAGEGERFLVVSPASVLHNWIREIRQRTDLEARLLHGDGRDAAFRAWLESGGVAVTSFRTLQSLPVKPADFAATVDVLVVDEAHYVKNPEAERTKAVGEINEDARYVVFMTGTPLENRLTEFRQLVSYLQPGVAQKLAGSVSATGDLVLGRQKFQESVAPVYLRRNQADVLSELPERIDKEEWVALFPEEESAYREAVSRRDIMGMRRAATVGAGAQRSAKLGRLAELLDEYRESGRKVLVFSFFLDVLDAVHERFGGSTVGKITGAVAPEERLELCDALAAHEGHALLLAQIQAGGVGLNLQAASVVVLLEPQWKPSTEEQAIARAHRMGQTRPVEVHRFLAKDSVDERMQEVLTEKQELFDTFARGSVIKDASHEATEASLTKQVIDAEVERLGVTDPPAERTGT